MRQAIPAYQLELAVVGLRRWQRRRLIGARLKGRRPGGGRLSGRLLVGRLILRRWRRIRRVLALGRRRLLHIAALLPYRRS